jgi:hypothetical protein
VVVAAVDCLPDLAARGWAGRELCPCKSVVQFGIFEQTLPELVCAMLYEYLD